MAARGSQVGAKAVTEPPNARKGFQSASANTYLPYDPNHAVLPARRIAARNASHRGASIVVLIHLTRSRSTRLCKRGWMQVPG